MKRLMVALTMISVGLLANTVWADTFKVDPDHSTVGFKIRHLLGNVNGTFDQFEGTIDYDPAQPELSKTSGTIQTASINTRVSKRDDHLRGGDFFDVEKFPQIAFTSTKVLESTPEGGKLEGVLMIHGVEKPVVLNVEIHGIANDPWGHTRAAFTATTKINRQDFGLTWNKAVEAGKFLVGDEVTITIEAEAIKQ
ncbi:MAG: polyisoprenoid-binding protein [Candidatus Omnitrophica bacterium]|nr:polyisoprenoid-binding protein [Candidatus Omnitrophota bacterium]